MRSVLDHLQNAHWRAAIENRVSADTITAITEFLTNQLAQGIPVLPKQAQWFRALNEIEPSKVRVVILGQDPYHGEGQAQGLSFSVPSSMKLPPSLRNIFKELVTDLYISNSNGDLSHWAEQGVLLLNAVLTVEMAKAGSHARQGWEEITDAVIRAVSDENQHVVFMLWGGYAEKKVKLINPDKHLILTAAHPSPLSAHRGWFGSRHFSKANNYLEKHGLTAIDWQTSTTQMSIF